MVDNTPILGVPYYIRNISSGLYLSPKEASPYPLLVQAPLMFNNPYQQWVFVGSGSNPGCYAMNLGNAQVISSSLIDPELFIIGMGDMVTQFWLFALTEDESLFGLANLRGDVIRLMTAPDPNTGNDEMFILDYVSGSYLETQLFGFELA